MQDHVWNTQFTEFDIVEAGDARLLMSLPQMRNSGFEFEPAPDKAFVSCARDAHSHSVEAEELCKSCACAREAFDFLLL